MQECGLNYLSGMISIICTAPLRIRGQLNTELDPLPCLWGREDLLSVGDDKNPFCSFSLPPFLHPPFYTPHTPSLYPSKRVGNGCTWFLSKGHKQTIALKFHYNHTTGCRAAALGVSEKCGPHCYTIYNNKFYPPIPMPLSPICRRTKLHRGTQGHFSIAKSQREVAPFLVRAN